MRIDRIRIGGFGRLHDFDTGPDSLPDLVVVLGPNEAGKSTLFTFLTTALYGFQPATRERNPHVPWGADLATGGVRVRLDSGGCAEIERTLRSQPTGRLVAGGRTTDLRNHPVPWVDHVPRTVFRQVFAITLGELAGLDGETWARIQDKMIGSMGAADIRSAREVAEALEKEAGEIWRPNRRGNQRLRELQAELRELRSRRSEALERDARIRRLVEEREDARDELQRVRERRQLDRAEVERARSLLPVKRQLERIGALRLEGGDRDRLRDLPGDPVDRYEELRRERSELDRVLQRLESDVAEREATVRRTEGSAALLERREEIIEFVAAARGSAHARVRSVELAAEIADLEARLDATAATVLSESWRSVPGDALASVPAELLRERISRARRAELTRDATGAAGGGPPTWLAVAAGAALLAWGLTTARPIVTAVGGAALAAAITWWWTRSRAGRPPGAADRFAEGPEVGHGGGAGIAELLESLPVRAELRARPDETLVSGLERLRDLHRQRTERARARDANLERVTDVDRAARDLIVSLGGEPSGDAEVVARDLDRSIREAERLHDAAVAAERDLERLRREREEIAERATRTEAELDALVETARAITPGDRSRALEAARTRIEAHERADQLEDELVGGHPDLEELRAQIEELDRSEHEWSVDEEALARARARIEAHDERIEELLTRGEALDAEIGRLRDLDTVDAVDGEIASLREQEVRLTRARDRKWVLAQLLREADRHFREEHQPDLVRRAGSYLEHLTGGRYERLVVDETRGDHLFHLVGPHLPAPIPLAPPVSTGTLEQAYLSLRLAIVDHLDQGGEKLPLFVDEILVNWDGSRRVRGLDVLAGISSTRQVFVFTCHPSVAAELEERGANVLPLPDR